MARPPTFLSQWILDVVYWILDPKYHENRALSSVFLAAYPGTHLLEQIELWTIFAYHNKFQGVSPEYHAWRDVLDSISVRRGKNPMT